MKKSILSAVLVVIAGFLYAQEFGFGFGEESGDSGGSGGNAPALTVAIDGEVSASLLGYFKNFSEGAELGDIFSGKLNFSAGTSFAEGVIKLNFQVSEQPVSIDEAYVRAYFGNLEIEGGLRKLTWGKADSLGPLDVINPLDYSDMTDLSDMMNLKIARPLIHASYRIGSFSKIEAVFVPTFQPLRFAEEGRWVPAQMGQLIPSIVNQSNTSSFEYVQAGVRFTTTFGPADVGMQYYYGHLTRPAVSTVLTSAFPPMTPPTPTAININYNPYHQIGVDWAQVLFGFNVRAEFAANITYDSKGDDPAVYNPSLLWSFGFDRELFAGINLNFQCNETIRLMHDKIDNKMFINVSNLTVITDTEAGTDITSTQIITAVSKKFFRDALETRIALMWGIEDKDFLLIPSLVWTRDTLSIELSAGIFGGDKDGQFGQFKDNSFIKTVLTYSF